MCSPKKEKHNFGWFVIFLCIQLIILIIRIFSNVIKLTVVFWAVTPCSLVGGMSASSGL